MLARDNHTYTKQELPLVALLTVTLHSTAPLLDDIKYTVATLSTDGATENETTGLHVRLNKEIIDAKAIKRR